MSDVAVPDIAVTVVGGYLGAGKTTLLNHILRNADQRIAVVVNDFGDINIDEALIESRDGDTLSLANGCICCSLIDGFAAALDTIQALEPRPERLVIEASGVADPATVAAWGHGRGFALDATVVLADAETVRVKATDKYVGDTVKTQLRAADIVVLNKIDLCDPAALEQTRAWLLEQCADAVIVEATQAEVDPLLLFGVGPRDLDVEPGHIHAHEIFETWDWNAEGVQTRAGIEAMMRELPDTVVRAKGILWLDDEPDHEVVLQRVGKRWSLRRGRALPERAERTNQLLFIGVIDNEPDHEAPTEPRKDRAQP